MIHINNNCQKKFKATAWAKPWLARKYMWPIYFWQKKAMYIFIDLGTSAFILNNTPWHQGSKSILRMVVVWIQYTWSYHQWSGLEETNFDWAFSLFLLLHIFPPHSWCLALFVSCSMWHVFHYLTFIHLNEGLVKFWDQDDLPECIAVRIITGWCAVTLVVQLKDLISLDVLA